MTSFNIFLSKTGYRNIWWDKCEFNIPETVNTLVNRFKFHLLTKDTWGNGSVRWYALALWMWLAAQKKIVTSYLITAGEYLRDLLRFCMNSYLKCALCTKILSGAFTNMDQRVRVDNVYFRTTSLITPTWVSFCVWQFAYPQRRLKWDNLLAVQSPAMLMNGPRLGHFEPGNTPAPNSV